MPPHVTSGQPLMKPPHDVQDHARAPEYTTSAPTLRGAWAGGGGEVAMRYSAPLRSEMGLGRVKTHAQPGS
jgi:hypothetical protein